MSTSEAAEIIGCTTSHVRAMIAAGKIKAKQVKYVGNDLGYRWDISRREAERYRDAPTDPRGRRRGHVVS